MYYFLYIIIVIVILIAPLSIAEEKFKDIVLAEADKKLKIYEGDYNWLVANSNWDVVSTRDTSLKLYGVDMVLPDNYGSYLREILGDSVLKGAGVISTSNVESSIEEILVAVKYASEVVRVMAFTSIETHLGGSFRATVAIVLARKNKEANKGTAIGSVVYKATYDITVKDNAYPHHPALGLEHAERWLEKAKGWATYKALTDFQTNADKLLMFLLEPGKIGVFHSNSDYMASF